MSTKLEHASSSFFQNPPPSLRAHFPSRTALSAMAVVASFVFCVLYVASTFIAVGAQSQVPLVKDGGLDLIYEYILHHFPNHRSEQY